MRQARIIKNSALNDIFDSDLELIVHGMENGQFNMDFDMNRANDVRDGRKLPIFRLYGWSPWTVSLGYNQKDNDIDRDMLSKKGFDLVRRPTGGRAVLHANEITYSVVIKIKETRNQHDLYKKIHEFLLKGLSNLGVDDLQFEKSNPDFREFYKRNEMSVSCFASAAMHEIEFNGRKVVGSAQRLFGDTLLQHGSILIGNGHEQLSEVIVTSNDEVRFRLRDYISSHSATLSEASGKDLSYEEVRDSILDSL